MKIDKSLNVEELVSKLVAVDTQNPGGDEVAGLQVLAEYLETADATVTIDRYEEEHANLTATAVIGNGDGPVIMLNSHIDVVPAGGGWSVDPFDPIIRNGRIYGRGSADAKGSLGAMAKAMVSVLSNPAEANGTILFTAVGDEEVGSSGARVLIKTVEPDFCIVGEPTNIRLLSAHKGSIRPIIEVSGVAAHAATPDRGVNAIVGSSKLIDMLLNHSVDLLSRDHPLTGSPTLTPVLINGGQAPNAVPERCQLTLDRRLVPGEGAKDAISEIQAVLDHFNVTHAPFHAQIVELAPSTGGPSETDQRDPFVLRCQTAMESIGEDSTLSGLVVNCDMTTFRAANIPTIIFGPGTLEVMHAKDEYVDIDQLHRAERGYEAMLRKLLGS